MSDSFQPANGSDSGSREIADEGNAFIGIPRPTRRPTVGRISGSGDVDGPTVDTGSAAPSPPEDDQGAASADLGSCGEGVPSAVRATTGDDAGGAGAVNAESDTGSLAERTSTTRR